MALSEEEARLRRLARMKAWRASHAKEKREYQRAWNAAHRKEKQEYNRRWYASHGPVVGQECNGERARRYHVENKEKKNAASRAHYYANREKMMEQSRQWKLEHPEEWRAMSRDASRLRRARRRAVGWERIKAADIFERDGWRCQICGCETLREWEADNVWSPELDHIIPLARGGPHTRANTQLLCRRCNAHKAAKLPYKHTSWVENVERGRS